MEGGKCLRSCCGSSEAYCGCWPIGRSDSSDAGKRDSESEVGISSVQACVELSVIVQSVAGDRAVSRVATQVVTHHSVIHQSII